MQKLHNCLGGGLGGPKKDNVIFYVTEKTLDLRQKKGGGNSTVNAKTLHIPILHKFSLVLKTFLFFR